MVALVFPCVGNAFDGEIVALGAAAGEDDLIRLGADQERDALPCLLDGLPGLLSEGVHTRGVSVIFRKEGKHRGDDFRIEGVVAA